MQFLHPFVDKSALWSSAGFPKRGPAATRCHTKASQVRLCCLIPHQLFGLVARLNLSRLVAVDSAVAKERKPIRSLKSSLVNHVHDVTKLVDFGISRPGNPKKKKKKNSTTVHRKGSCCCVHPSPVPHACKASSPLRVWLLILLVVFWETEGFSSILASFLLCPIDRIGSKTKLVCDVTLRVSL